MKKQQKLFLLGLFICIFALAIPSFFAKADIENSNIATNSDAIVENSEGEVTTAEVLNEQTSEESSNIETLETSEETENLSFVTQSIDTNSVDDIEFLEEDEVLLGSPAPTNVVEINSQEDWNEFITLKPSAENPDCPWGNSGGSCIYIGADSEVTIKINADITVTSGSPWFIDGNSTVPTKFNITGNGSVKGTFLFPTQYEYSISGIKFIDSTVEVKGTTVTSNASFENTSVTLDLGTDLNLTGCIFSGTNVEFNATAEGLNCSLNGCAFSNATITSRANPLGWTFTNTDISDSSILENSSAICTSLTINGGTFSNDTTAFALIGDSAISNAIFTNTDINYLNNVATTNTITGCTFNNSHFTSDRSSSFISIADSNFDGNTKSIIENIGSGSSPAPVVVALNNITGTNCHANFISQQYKNLSLLKVKDFNISTTDEGLIGINLRYMNSRVADIENATISGFAEGIHYEHISYTDLTSIAGENPHPYIDNINNVTVTGCNIGMYLISGSYVHVTDSNITCKGVAVTSTKGIHFKNYAQSSQSSLENTLQDKETAYYNIFDNCEVNDCYVGFYGDTSIGALLVDSCNFVNVNSGYEIHGGASGDAPQSVFKESIFSSRDNYDSNSIGLNLSKYGSSNTVLVVDCDITGFSTGIEHTTGGYGYYIGNKINNAGKYGIRCYCDTIADCSFEGSTEVFIYNGTSTVDIQNIKIVGNDNNIGMYSNSSTFTINTFLEPISVSGGGYGRASYERFKVFSDRTFTDGKTDIQNCKIGVKHTSSPLYMRNTYIHDCETGIENTGSNHFWYGNNVIDNCVTGYLTNEMRAAYVVNTSVSEIDKITNCETGLKFSGSGGWYDGMTTLQPNGYILSIENNDIGIDASLGTHMYTYGIDFVLKNNDIGMILTPVSSGGIKSIATDSNNVQAMIISTNGYNNSYAHRIQKLNLSNDVQAIKLDGVVHIMNSYEGQGTIYLDTPESYIYNTATYNDLSNYIIFDMPNSDYQEDRIVSKVNDPNWVNNYWAKSSGWIVAIKSLLDDEGNPLSQFDCILNKGCLVTYDYFTNGGTEVTGYVTGSEMFVNSGSPAITAFDVWKYKSGNPIDLSPVAVKDGYEFVGWNTDPNATEGLTSLTAGTTDITLYAIYRTTKTITYHTYDADDNYTQDVYLYNNQTETISQLAAYPVTPSDLYEFVGYVFSENVSDVTNSIMHENDNFTVSDNRLNVYCVYDTHSVLTYKDVAGNTIATDNSSMRAAATNIISATFRYILINKVPIEGYTFDGWIDSQGGIHPAGEQYLITDHEATLTAKESEIKVNKVQLAPKTAEIYVGDKIQFTVTVTPDNALNKDVAWSVDSNKAEITNDGLLTGLEKGTVTVTATNINSGKADTATVVIKDAKSDNPSISISEDYKVTITAGDVQDDELDKIYYRINGGEWKEYTGKFPVFKKFKVEAYQITKIKRVQSDIVELSGTEYATGITAEYIGDPKPIGTDVTKPEVIVTIHYPNSPDEVVTDFSLEDYTIDEEGPNDVTVVYNEYPDDADSPELTTTVTVIGIPIDEKPDVRIVTIKGRLLYADGSPIANKTIVLNWHEDESKEEKATETSAVKGAASLTTQTDADGNYVFESIQVGEYQMEIKDGNTTLATCIINVKAPKEDSVDVKRSLDNVEVDYSFSDSIITIDATITIPKEETPAEPTPADIEPPTEKPPTEEPVPTSVKTGDNAKPLFVGIVCIITIISMVVLIRIKKKL